MFFICAYVDAGGVGYSPSSAANGSDDLSMQKEDFPALPGSATKSTPEQLQYQQSFGSLISGGSLFNGGGGFNLNAADNQSFPSLQASLGASSEAVKSPAGTMMGGSSNSVIGSNGNSVRGSSQVSGGSADGSQTQGGSSNSTMGSLIGNSGSEGGTTAAAAVVAAAGVKPSSAHSDSSIGGGLESKFGLSGLLDIIRLTDKVRTHHYCLMLCSSLI